MNILGIGAKIHQGNRKEAYMPSIHDSIVMSYEVNLQCQKIVFHTQNKSAADIDEIEITFSNVLAHSFENELPGSVLYEISEHGIHEFLEDNRILLEKGKPYCWPVDFDTLDELQGMLFKEHYLYYRISSSYGLNGWVLAKQYEAKVD